MIRFKYHHKEGLQQSRKGDFIVSMSRNTSKTPPINRKAMWQNYRLALSHATLDCIEQTRPNVYELIRTQLDIDYQRSKFLAIKIATQASPREARWKLSLQILLWGQIKAWERKTQSAEEYGFYQKGKLSGWQSEAASIIADVQKLGWSEIHHRNDVTRKKLESRIEKSRDKWDQARLIDKLSGKRRTYLNDMKRDELKLQALWQLEQRQKFIREIIPE